VKSGQFDLNNGLNETADAQQQFSLRSSMDLPRNIEFDTGLRWVDTLHNNNGATRVPFRRILNWTPGWHGVRPKRLSFPLVGQNLLHDHHPEYGFPGPNREEIERNIYGKLTLSF